MQTTQRIYQILIVLLFNIITAPCIIAQSIDTIQQQIKTIEKKLFGDLSLRGETSYMSDEAYLNYLQLIDKDSIMAANLFDTRKRLESGQAVSLPRSEFNWETRQIVHDTITFTTVTAFDRYHDSLTYAYKEESEKQNQVDTTHMSATERISQTARKLTKNEGFGRYIYVMDSLVAIEEGRSTDYNDDHCAPEVTFWVRLSQPSLKEISLLIHLASQEDSMSLAASIIGWQFKNAEWKTERTSIQQNEQHLTWQLDGSYIGRLTMEGAHTDTTRLSFSGRIEQLPGCRTTGIAKKLSVSDSTPWIDVPKLEH